MNKTLEELAFLIPDTKIVGNKNIEITGIEHDSRKIKQGNLFVCMEGAHVDGHKFINQAVERGAVAVLTARQNFFSYEISALIVPDMLKSLAVIVPYEWQDDYNLYDSCNFNGGGLQSRFNRHNSNDDWR